LTELARY